MKLSAILAPMIAAGVPGDVILDTVRAFESEQSDALARRRASDAKRQADKRDREKKSRDVTLHHSDRPLAMPGPAHVEDNLLTKELDGKKENKNFPLSEPSGSSTKFRDGQFAEWWEVYPRKVSKADARKQFDKALTVTDFASLMASVRRFAIERRGEDQQFTMHPDRWLRGQHWGDEPAPPPLPRSGAPPMIEPRNPGERAMQFLERTRNEPPSPAIKRLDEGDGLGQARSARADEWSAVAKSTFGEIR